MKILVLPGDGIGPEITDATLKVLEAARTRFGLPLELLGLRLQFFFLTDNFFFAPTQLPIESFEFVVLLFHCLQLILRKLMRADAVMHK